MTVVVQEIPRTQVAAHEGSIGRGTAAFLCISFVICLTIPGVHQLVHELRQDGHWRFVSLFQQAPTTESLRSFEDALAKDSVLAEKVRTAYQTMLTRRLGLGNENIVISRDGFLFYRTEVDMACGPGFLTPRREQARAKSQFATFNVQRPASNVQQGGPVAAICDFDAQLRSRGIHLVFVPIPPKPFIYPEKLWPGYPASTGPAWNVDREVFKARLNAAGVDVLDITDDLWREKNRGGSDLFLKLDTHWSPRGLAIAADCIAAHSRPLVAVGSAVYTPRQVSVRNRGDLLRMLDIGEDRDLFPAQTVQITQALDGDRFVRGDDDSPILLLGDSFTNVYSRPNLGWGEGAGLGEQLMLRLATPIQTIAIDGGGATAVREALAQRPAALAKKKLVIWACSARDLGDRAMEWELVKVQ